MSIPQFSSEAYKTAGDSIYEFAKVGPKERDAMEARFKHVQGPAPPPERTPLSRIASGENTGRIGSPVAANRFSHVTPLDSPALARPSLGRAESPEKPVPVSPTKPVLSPRASNGSATPNRGIPRFGAPASRPMSMMQPRQSLASQVPPAYSTETPAMAAPAVKHRAAGQLFAPLRGRSSSATQEVSSNGDTSKEVVQTIRSILSSDPNRSVDGLKRVQRMLDTQHSRFLPFVDALVQALVKQIRLVFDAPSRLDDSSSPWFRLAKHLIQTLNNFCDHNELIKEIGPVDTEELLFELTLRLLQTDDATGGACRPSEILPLTGADELSSFCRRQGSLSLPELDPPPHIQRWQAREHL